jgi:L-iditol 2-dehydrogenase
MKAAITDGTGNLRITDISSPTIKDNKGALIRVAGCGLCGSDIVKIKRGLAPEGSILGHEVVGIITEIGTSSQTSLIPGDKVAVAHHIPCMKCRYCLQKSYSMCETFKMTNFVPGGFAETIYISDLHLKQTTIKVPLQLSDVSASAMEPVACILRALEKANVTSGQNVFVIGLGYIGLLFTQALKMIGTKVVACDLIEERLTLALKYGADFAFSPLATQDPTQIISKQFKFKGADTVILASGATASVDLALNTVRDGGTICVFASIPDNNMGFFNNALYYRELSVIGAYSSAPAYLLQAMNLLANETIIVDEFYDILPLEDINTAINSTTSHKSIKVYLKI